MYVLAVFESRDQRLVTAQVGHQAQFHLTVIGRKQQVLIVRRDERLPDPASQLVPHGNILQVGIGRGEPSGRCHGWLNDVWILPVTGLTSRGNAST